MESKNLEGLRTQAERVNEQHVAMETAYSAAREAEAELLTAIIAAVRPGLRALCSRLESSREVVGHGDVNRQRYTTRHFKNWRGVVVAGDGRREDNPRDNRGCWEGSELVLREDGSLVELSYEGDWSRWQGSNWGWRATLTVLTPLQAVADYEVEAVADRLAGLLQRQLDGRAAKRTQAAQNRAARLHALAALLH